MNITSEQAQRAAATAMPEAPLQNDIDGYAQAITDLAPWIDHTPACDVWLPFAGSGTYNCTCGLHEKLSITT